MNETTNEIGPVVVGVDHSDTAFEAARRAARLAEDLGRRLHVVMALQDSAVRTIRDVGSDHYVLDGFSLAEHSLRGIVAKLHTTAPVTTAARVAGVAEAIVTEATHEGASLIVIGNRRVQERGHLRSPIAVAVAHSAPCDVLVVHTFEGRTPCVDTSHGAVSAAS